MKEIVIKISEDVYNIINGKTDVANVDLYSELISAVQTGVPLQKGTDIKEIIDVVHKTIYQFFDVCEEGEEMPLTDKDKLLLSVNKAICNNLKVLEPKTGHWIEVDRNRYSCSNCGHCFSIVPEDNSIKEYKVCPNCGVRMESEDILDDTHTVN